MLYPAYVCRRRRIRESSQINKHMLAGGSHRHAFVPPRRSYSALEWHERRHVRQAGLSVLPSRARASGGRGRDRRGTGRDQERSLEGGAHGLHERSRNRPDDPLARRPARGWIPARSRLNCALSGRSAAHPVRWSRHVPGGAMRGRRRGLVDLGAASTRSDSGGGACATAGIPRRRTVTGRRAESVPTARRGGGRRAPRPR